MGTVAYSGTLGQREQCHRMWLFDRGGIFQLLANCKAGHGGEYELCCPGDGGDCHLQPGLLSRMGEESVHGTGGRGDVNA